MKAKVRTDKYRELRQGGAVVDIVAAVLDKQTCSASLEAVLSTTDKRVPEDRRQYKSIKLKKNA
jgi:hypothetical protein